MTAAERTWYYDGPYTHGVAGLACVSDDGPHASMAGIGPDGEFTGTTAELVAELVRQGFTEIDTDVTGLAVAWYGEVGVIADVRDGPGDPGWPAGRPWTVTTPGGEQWNEADDDDARASLARHLIAAGRMEAAAWDAQLRDTSPREES